MYYVFRHEIKSWRNGILQAWASQTINYQQIKPHWWLAQPLTSPPPKLEFLMDSKAPKLDNQFTGTDLDLYSSRFIEIIRAAGVNFETFPIILRDRDTREVLPLNYELFHLLEKYPALDWERSELESEGLSIRKVKKLVLVDNFLESRKPLVRLSEMKQVVLMHENLKNTLDRAGITGCLYVAVDKYQSL